MQVQQVKYRTPEQVMKLWIKSLRSGKYKQTRNLLKGESGGFCCLGVLCDLAAKDGGQQWKRNKFNAWEYGNKYIGNAPKELTRYLGISNVEVMDLIEMNDCQNRSFKQIADHIEQELLPKVPK